MVEYTPPPADLSTLNPIQRYMQKGQLEWNDYMWLAVFVLAYFHFRPRIQDAFKWWMGGNELKEGEDALKEYQEAKVKPDAIRDQSKELAISEGGTTASGSSTDRHGEVSNRKNKTQTTEEKQREKSELEKLLDWDDEPARKPEEGDKAEVTEWLDKWDR